MYSLRSGRKVEVKEPIDEKILNKRVNVKRKDLPDSDKKRKFDETKNLPRGSTPKKKACAKESNVHIDSLPTEIMIKIFQHFSQNELGRFAQVNKRWYELTRCAQLWKPVDVLFQWKNGSQNKVATLFLESLPASLTHLRLHFWSLDWNKPLNFSVFCVKLRKKCPSLKVLILQFAVFDVNLQSVIYLCSQHLQNLEVLSFGQCTFTDKSVKRRKDDNFYSDDLLKISLSRMINLQKLSICCMEANDSRFRAGPSFSGKTPSFGISYRHFHLMNDHVSKLKELNLCGTSVILRGIDLRDQVFSQLKTICLKRCKNIKFKCIVDLIYSSEFLENIYVDDEIAEPFVQMQNFVDEDGLNGQKLQIVKTSETCRHCENDYLFEQ